MTRLDDTTAAQGESIIKAEDAPARVEAENRLPGAAKPTGATVACAAQAERPTEGRDLSDETRIKDDGADLSDEEESGARDAASAESDRVREYGIGQTRGRSRSGRF